MTWAGSRSRGTRRGKGQTGRRAGTPRIPRSRSSRRVDEGRLAQEQRRQDPQRGGSGRGDISVRQHVDDLGNGCPPSGSAAEPCVDQAHQQCADDAGDGTVRHRLSHDLEDRGVGSGGLGAIERQEIADPDGRGQQVVDETHRLGGQRTGTPAEVAARRPSLAGGCFRMVPLGELYRTFAETLGRPAMQPTQSKQRDSSVPRQAPRDSRGRHGRSGRFAARDNLDRGRARAAGAELL